MENCGRDEKSPTFPNPYSNRKSISISLNFIPNPRLEIQGSRFAVAVSK